MKHGDAMLPEAPAGPGSIPGTSSIDGTLASDLKAELARGRESIKTLHVQGALGRQVAAAMADLCDHIVGRAFATAVARLAPEDQAFVSRNVALVAIGGYGRGELSPCSDVDLLFLVAPGGNPAVRQLVSGLVRDLWDAGLTLSQSVRTPADCIIAARGDLLARTALLELRLLQGAESLFSDLQHRMLSLRTRSAIGRFLNALLAERCKEHADNPAGTVCLLEPNVKKSPGGLRDLHLLRWVAAIRHATADPEMLLLAGALTREDFETVMSSSELLHSIRNELHFHAGSAQDVLTLEEQMRLAERFGFQSTGPLRGVERFMQQYYRQTSRLHDLAYRFVEKARPVGGIRALADRLLTRRVEQHFLVSPRRIAIHPHTPDNALAEGGTLLTLFELARGYGVPVDHASLERARSASLVCSITREVRTTFLRMLANPAGLGTLLRNLHRVGLLSRLIPQLEHSRGLIQFNPYHKYTIDEHSIRVVEAAASRLDEESFLGQAYREVHRKDLMHLALLVHDLGKGLGEDHCELGGAIAEDVASQFSLSRHDRDLVVFLVRNHLMMANIAFRRDIHDLTTLVRFVRGVSTPEILRMLFVMTAADTEAVAPGSWTAWKESLLTDLYILAAEELAGTAPVADEEARARDLRNRLFASLEDRFPPPWLREQLEAMPLSYMARTPVELIAGHLAVLRGLGPSGVRVESRYDAKLSFVEYTVFAREGLTPGPFSKITAVFAATGFQIVGADIVTRTDDVIVDTFRGVDSSCPGEPPEYRRREIAKLIEEVLRGKLSVDALFARFGRSPALHDDVPLTGAPQVEIDNDSSDRFTIIEIFADDRQGRLYAISRAIFELGLSVHSAKISTRVDQIVDAFYVTGEDGLKVTDETRQEAIRRHLLEVVGGA